MKKGISKSEVKEKIEKLFANEQFTPEEVKKVKRVAMKFNIKLKTQRRLFCKKCLSKLKGKTRVTNSYRTIVCSSCGTSNRQIH